MDSFVGEVCGRLKQGAAYGYTKLLGYHRSSPPVPTPGRCSYERACPSSAASWRTCPKVNARRNVPSIECTGHPATQQPPRTPGAQHLAIINAVRAQHHREQERHHLSPGVRRSRPLPPQPHQPPRHLLDLKPLGERRDQHHSRGICSGPRLSPPVRNAESVAHAVLTVDP